MQIDETYARALRSLLVEQVKSSSAPSGRRRWRRWQAGVAAGAAIAAGGGGLAYATGAFSLLPGADEVTQLAAPVVVTGTGTETVRLGSRPAGATSIDLKFTCLSAGTFRFADGARIVCQDPAASPALYRLALAPGQTTTKITATPRARWRLVTSYARVRTTRWAVNASGQTYGVANQHGTPDLVAVTATNGRTGYVYSKQLNAGPDGAAPTTPAQASAQSGRSYTLGVYEPDGKTKIGTFRVGG